MLTNEEIKLRKELWWVYQNILEPFGKFNKEEIKKRMDELRYLTNYKGGIKHGL